MKLEHTLFAETSILSWRSRHLTDSLRFKLLEHFFVKLREFSKPTCANIDVQLIELIATGAEFLT